MSRKRSHSKIERLNSDDDEGNINNNNNNENGQVSEEWYRRMLGEHVVKYKRRSKDATPSPASSGRFNSQTAKNSVGVRERKMDKVSDWLNGTGHRKPVSYSEPDFPLEYGNKRY